MSIYSWLRDKVKSCNGVCLSLWLALMLSLCSAHQLPAHATPSAKTSPLNSLKHESDDTADILVIPSSLERHREGLSQALIEARRAVEDQLGVSVPAIRLYLSATPNEMRALARENQNALPPSWSAGLAFPKSRAVYIPVTSHAELAPLMRHELVHIALAEAKIPLWVNEGLSVTLGEGLSLERLWTLNEAAAAQTLHSLADLTRRFPEHGHPAQVAYAQSGHFIHYLREAEGAESLRAWVKALTRGASLTEASEQHLQNSLQVHESQWREGLKRGPLAWLALTAKSETLWALTILLFVILGGRKLKRRRQNLRHLVQPDLFTPRVVTARPKRGASRAQASHLTNTTQSHERRI